MLRSMVRCRVLRRPVGPIARLSTSTTRALATTSTSSWNASQDNNQTFPWMWVLAAATATTVATTRCEAKETGDEDATTTPHEDPYDNLPEGDEPTHCSICKTYRQGPCRPYWRKVEACTKDQDSLPKREDDDDNDSPPPCMKYILPWIDCASGLRNLYNLIELDTNYTLGIKDLEQEATQNLCWTKAKTPRVNWSEWQTYVADHADWKPNEETTVTDKPGVPLWQTLDTTQGDPEVVTVEATVSMFEDWSQEENCGILECSYAVDQNGNVIGFSYGQKPGSNETVKTDDKKTTEEEGEGVETSKNDDEVVETSKNDDEAVDKSGDEEDEKKAPVDESPTVTLTIRILPLHTTHVTIAASYVVPSKGDNGDEKETDSEISHVYKSKPFSLADTGKKDE